MSTAASSPVWLRRFTKVMFGATLLLVFVGGLVTTTGSGLAVPDWPLSFGQYFPPMVGGVLFEHGHRMVAGTVGIMMTALAIAIWLVERRRWVKWLALGAWLAVVLQAILGGITVLYKLPTPISVSHAGLATIFLSMTAILAVVTSRAWESGPAAARFQPTRGFILLCVATAIVVYGQIILGATMRHMGMGQQGLAIPDFPLSYGKLIPPRLDLAPILVHFLHRVGALVVGFFILATAMRIRRQRGVPTGLRTLSYLLVALYLLQFVLGAFTIWTVRGMYVTTLHVAIGGLIFALSAVMAFSVLGFRQHSVSRVSAVAAASGATA